MTPIPLVHVEPRDGAVACTLTPGEYENRTATLSDLAARALMSRTPIDGGQRLTFIDIPVVERELRTAVAAEASCCGFLAMDLTRTRDALVLDITGPEHAAPVIAELFA